MRKGSILVAVGVIGILVWHKMSERNDADRETLEAMQELISELDVYPANREYLDGLLTREHKEAFSSSYSAGSRHRPARFDQSKYVQELFDAMIRDCDSRKKQDLAEALRTLKQVTLLAVSSPE